MIVTLQRERDDGLGTQGTLKGFNGEFLGYTLEPSAKHITRPCIFAGTYTLAYTMSPRFEKKLLEVCFVPRVKGAKKPVWKFPNEWRQGIRIHSFNTPEQSDGCIGIGKNRNSNNFIGMSRIAVKAFEDYVLKAMGEGKVVQLRVLDPI
jgi:hypothetical protein